MLVVLVVMAAAAVALVVLTQRGLRRTVEATVIARADDLAALAAAGNVPGVLAPGRGVSAQIVEGGRVVVSTADIEGQAPIGVPTTASGSARVIRMDAIDDAGGSGDAEGDSEEGPFLVAVAGYSGPNGDGAAIVAGSLAVISETTRTLTPILWIGVPLVVLLVGWMTLVLTRRAFLPVEAMRSEAERITVGDLHRRVPVAAGNDEIGRLGDTLNRMLDRLESSVTRQRRFVADAGHELKSPVATLLTMAEVTEGGASGLSMEEFARDVADQSRRLAELVEDLLTLARRDEGRLELALVHLDLGEVVAEEVSLSSSPSVVIDLSGVGAVAAVVDRRRVRQIVRNLVDNAIRHAVARVSVGVVGHDNLVEITVGDDGPGIDPAERRRVFERFVRLDLSRDRDAGGTGLGLSVVSELVAAHGGSIAVDDDPDLGGARFTVTLPRFGQPD
jgi:signal transduction histidine kinase